MDIATNKLWLNHKKQNSSILKKIETNKYPYILFFRYNKYSFIDEYFISNKDKLNCSIFFINQAADLNLLFNSSYQILFT